MSDESKLVCPRVTEVCQGRGFIRQEVMWAEHESEGLAIGICLVPAGKARHLFLVCKHCHAVYWRGEE